MAGWDLRGSGRPTPAGIWGILAPGASIGGKVTRVQQQSSPFAAYIRQRRLQLGLSQEQVARRAGEEFQANYIAKLERDGVETPSRDRLRKLAHALEAPIADLRALIYPDEGETPPPLPPHAPPVIDPALPGYIQDALRPLVGKIPDEDVRATGRMLAGMVWKTRAELEAELGPTKYRPPAVRDGGSRDGTAG